MPQGSSSLVVSAVDGGNTTKSNNYQISTKGAASQALVYDRNGNMTSDGTNSYLWDAENRLVQINYPGSGNNSQFSYDGNGELVAIFETVAGAVVSTKQFVLSANQKSEVRNASGGMQSQYFSLGQTMLGNNYFYSKDKISSITEVSDSTGALDYMSRYDLYGRSILAQGSFSPDFQYCGYYFHSKSSLNLTVYRAYANNLGRWINRDPLEENIGSNPYLYCNNSPAMMSDPSGLLPLLGPPIPMPPWTGGADDDNVIDFCHFKCAKKAHCFMQNCFIGRVKCLALAVIIYTTCYTSCKVGGPTATAPCGPPCK